MIEGSPVVYKRVEGTSSRSSRAHGQIAEKTIRGSSRVIRVFVVDDSAVARARLRALLEGHDEIRVVGEAADAEDAAQLIAESPPDVVLMDILLPQMDGIEATRRIKQQLPSVKVVLLSTLARQYLRQAVATSDGLAAKTVDPLELASIIRRVHEGHLVIERQLTPLLFSGALDDDGDP